MKNFFISYNKADRTWAEWIAWKLEEDGLTVIVQAWDFRAGSNFVLEMNRAAVEAAHTIAVLSPDFLTALFTQPEWAAAFARDPTGEKGVLVPVRVRECDIQGLLGQIVYIDLLKLDEADAERALLEGVKRGRAKPKEEPDFPGSPLHTITGKPRFPGAMPAIWNVPHLRNPNFTGRAVELSELRTSLLAGETAALVQAQAIHGLGGVGKTQLAVEYAYRHGADYEVVWWARSENPTTLASDYAGLAARLGLREKNEKEQHIIVEAVKEWLRQNRNWLLIFDNAEDVQLVRTYIPRGSAGHMIVTSRNPTWTGVAKPLSVKALPPTEAIEFLLTRTGHQDEEAAKTLAEALGRLPLALEQAGAYIETSSCTMRHYLDLFEKRQGELLRRGQPSTEYPDTVATTWSIAFQNIERDNLAATELLRLCAFFAPNDIPIKLLKDKSVKLPESLAAAASDLLLFDEVLMVLRKYSLVDVENDALSIHRLVQVIIRHTMSEEVLKKWTEAAVCVVDRVFPQESDQARTWAQCLLLLPHALSVLWHATRINLSTYETAELLNQVGLYLEGRAEYGKAKAMYERALAMGEVVLGLDHPDVAIYANNLGSALESLGELKAAKTQHERALAIAEASFGLNDLRLSAFANNLGVVLKSQGDFTGAKALFERAVAIDEAAAGLDHPNLAIRLNNLASALQSLGEDEAAKAHYERALTISEAAFGVDDPRVAPFANNLGLALKSQGDLAGARAYLERALRLLQESLGADHPHSRRVEQNLRLLEEDLKVAE